MKTVNIYTDGACSGNPGAGGWGAILEYKGFKKEMSGAEASTTNNRMELSAAVYALEALNEPCKVILTTDSQYLVNGMTKGWAKSWKKNGWIKSGKKPALNSDLWDRLLALDEIHDIKFVWVKGHAGHPENERCDRLAVGAYTKLKEGLKNG